VKDEPPLELVVLEPVRCGLHVELDALDGVQAVRVREIDELAGEGRFAEQFVVAVAVKGVDNPPPAIFCVNDTGAGA
jgi:hypothetical protein